MTERVRFYFDPRCPWCYLTSQWMRQLERLGEVEVSWALFSLAIANSDGDPADEIDGKGSVALRTIVALRDADGHEAVGPFYAELGAAIHDRGEDASDRAVLQRALEAVGASPALVDKALSDPATWDTVVSGQRELVERTRSFGVPTIALDDGAGLAIFGPVISTLPTDEDAVQLWRSVSWLTRYDNFSELKRERVVEPDLATFGR